jgi:transcription elongation factor Elf1
MASFSKDTYEALKLDCPHCGKPMTICSVENKHKYYWIVCVYKNGFEYTCLNCLEKK